MEKLALLLCCFLIWSKGFKPMRWQIDDFQYELETLKTRIKVSIP
jgi:hypothetical protein